MLLIFQMLYLNLIKAEEFDNKKAFLSCTKLILTCAIAQCGYVS